MIEIKTNIGAVINFITIKIKDASAVDGLLKDKMVRAVASSVGGDMKNRIHIQGQKADGEQIGTYSAQYLKLRQKKYKRSADPKVILSLTRQMENDFGLVATDPIKTQTGYGLGFKNPLDTVKAEHMEQLYGSIYSLTPKEKQQVKITAEGYVKQFASQFK